MNRLKPIAVASLYTLACGAAIAICRSYTGQLPSGRSPSSPTGSVSRNTDPIPLPGETPQQLKVREAHLWAVRDAIYRRNREATAALATGDYAAAEDAARQSVSLGYGSGLGEELLARVLFEQGKDNEALPVYRDIAKWGANAAHNEFPYALLLLKAGRWPQAVAAYNTALTLGGDTDLLRQSTRFSPGMPQPRELEAAIRIGLGMTTLGADTPGDQRRNSLALAHLQQAVALEPDSGLAGYYYGHALQQVGKRIEAKAALQKAAQMSSGLVKTAAENALQGR